MNTVINKAQLRRIESTHAGFLYQHLYAVACFLQAPSKNIQFIRIEKDEDIELQNSQNDQFYLQIKTRNKPIIYSDIKNSISLFSEIRKEHVNGKRKGKPHFYIICNNKFGPELIKKISENQFCNDITFISPGYSSNHFDLYPPPKTLEELFLGCCQLADTIHLGTLNADTLVYKLTSIMMQCATGSFSNTQHTIDILNFSKIVEQMIIQLQEFPNISEKYRPHHHELSFTSENRIRLIKGVAGVGKTTWASFHATFSPNICNYFDVTGIPAENLYSSLAREIIAKYSITNVSNKLALNSGLEAICMLDKMSKKDNIPIQIVLDNVHAIPSQTLLELINTTSHLKFILMGQIKEELNDLAIELDILPEKLVGWGFEEIKQEIEETHSNMLAILPKNIDKLQNITGGLPLFVKSALKLANTKYSNNLEHLCIALETQTHITKTKQEVLLSKIFDKLSDVSKKITAVLSCSYSLTIDEIQEIIQSPSQPLIAQAFRELFGYEIVSQLNNKKLKLHDEMRIVARNYFENLTEIEKKQIQTSLKDILFKSFKESFDLRNLHLYFQLLIELQDIEVLVDIATDSLFHELGFPNELWKLLEQVCYNKDIPAPSRFLAFDALIFNEIQNHNNYTKAKNYLIKMKELLEIHTIEDDHQYLKYLMKLMRVSAFLKDKPSFYILVEKSKNLLPQDFRFNQIHRYEVACGYFAFNSYVKAYELSSIVIDQYYTRFKITKNDLINLKNKELYGKLKNNNATSDDIKYLADALELFAKSSNKLMSYAIKERLQACFFYQQTNFIESYISTAQDLADDFLMQGDPIGAKQTIETLLLPTLHTNTGFFLHKSIVIKSQYAIILAHCKEYEEGYKVFDSLMLYRDSLTNDQEKNELNNQIRLFNSLSPKKLLISN